ncbi:MAG: circularly permuted type 2 ATP-grasp protein [Steroidobacteraceae bacterium]
MADPLEKITADAADDSPDPLDSYAGDARRYDELLDRSGTLRPHWEPLISRLAADGPEAAQRGVELARRLVIENGVTYNVYADPQGKDRPWALDPLPLLIAPAEWRRIEAGVAQRAHLLNALLADLYGPRKLLADGRIPPELPFGHPNYLWPCQGLKPRDGRWLHVYGVDLARAPDGRWWVLGDRAQTPSGPGYALENRQIVARVYPELIKAMNVRPISGYFTALRESLLGVSAASPDDSSQSSLAVVLTPGPFNETFFEHAYLARQLGLPLVEGNDLTVRANTVYLKTLSGLRRVHAILRRLDDDFCDPVELRADSTLGVPGLLGAVRAGRVTIANGLGTGVLESAAWLGFMPSTAEALLGETLQLPSVATWWCGEKPALDYVLRNLDRLVIKPTFPNQRFEPVFGRDVTGEARVRLLARLKTRPYAYVAQERLAFSQAPVWRAGPRPELAARALGIRVYAVATADGYSVMPGGMARIASDIAVDVVSTQRGGGSKDIWVLSSDGSEDTEASEPIPRGAVRHDELPSGLVENLFWLGRYTERCEDKTRLLRATFSVRAELQVWAMALESCHRFGVLDEEEEPTESLFDDEMPVGLASDLSRLAWCATRTRSKLSAEHWRSVSVLQRQLNEAAAARAEPRETLDRLLLALASFAGFMLDDMTQDDGWRLMMLGRRLERVQFLATLLRQILESEDVPRCADLDWVLDVGGSTITYRTRYLAAPRLALVIQLLVFDQSNPRSLAFHWSAIRKTLVQLAASLGGAVEDAMEDAIHRLSAAGLAQLEGAGEATRAARRELANALAALEASTGKLSDRLGMRHFSHTDRDEQTVAM